MRTVGHLTKLHTVTSPFDPVPLQQLRTLLEHFEHSHPYFDEPTAAALKRLLLGRIHTLEAAQLLASKTRDVTQK